MAPETNGNGTAVKVSLPSWVLLLFKNGPWAVLAAVLIWQLILQRSSDLSDVRAVLAASAQTISAVKTQMDNAEKTMNAAVARREARDEAVIQLLIQLCVQNANDNGQRQACFAAARVR